LGIEFTSHLLYNIYTMTTPDEQRKLVALRMLPSAHRQAKIAAVTEGKTLGVWIEGEGGTGRLTSLEWKN